MSLLLGQPRFDLELPEVQVRFNRTFISLANRFLRHVDVKNSGHIRILLKMSVLRGRSGRSGSAAEEPRQRFKSARICMVVSDDLTAMTGPRLLQEI
jgi:hypothetical protein